MKTTKEKELLEWGIKAFALARESEKNNADISAFVATTIGKHAIRCGFTKEDLSKWLQSAYSALWVKHSNLNPGLDMKDISNIVFKSFNKQRV